MKMVTYQVAKDRKSKEALRNLQNAIFWGEKKNYKKTFFDFIINVSEIKEQW